MGIKLIRSQFIQQFINEFPETEHPIAEFEEYKTVSLDFGDLPIPPYHEQLEHPAHIDTIGRDKPMDRPNSARYEELHHTHIWQEGCIWEDGDGLFVQWRSTSDTFVVYSYFLDADSDHHFYIIDFVRDQAHTIIEDSEQILKWVELARQHREANT
ncbi:type II toxin-antitoxin system YafO family toxin [Morganella psychrotolerans]|uniref:Uncharacterized protein n=1 Tax=Morganella psychrotolerans TaxID=368603 RepID=A0A1B8H704_9GAMM|nr:type II toxin-antitoxin system YafO family toxin [Morganella psychrotolerans]OBU04846.1 hypothetical protein AYY17_08095 [Morganella psychrotolerans]